MDYRCLFAFAPALALLAPEQPTEASKKVPEERKIAATASQAATGDARAIEGLWSGSWGGGGVDGVIFQPVVAELLIKGNRIEMYGFPNTSRLTGTVRLDADLKQIRVTSTVEPGRPAKVIHYAYRLKDNDLTLINKDKASISLEKCFVVRNPMANAKVEFVAANGINDAGELLVTEFIEVRAGTSYFRPVKRSLKTKQATVLVVQDAGLKKVTIHEARRLVGKSKLVVVTYQQDDRRPQQQVHELWKETGAPRPDSAAVAQTLLRILRPGTLVFVLSARENILDP